MGCVYMAKNLVNGKCYIGQTWNFHERKRQHLSRASRCKLFCQAIAKYGQESFTWTILADGIENQAELGRLEEKLIEQHGTLYPRGYNIAKGGTGGKFSEANKRAMAERARLPTRVELQRQIQTALTKTPEWRTRLAAGLAERNADPAYRQRFIEANSKRWQDPEFRARHAAAMKKSSSRPEWRAKMAALSALPHSNDWRKNVTAANTARALPVRCIDTGVVYQGGASEAFRDTGVNGPNITQCCRGKRSSAGRLRWEYAQL